MDMESAARGRVGTWESSSGLIVGLKNGHLLNTSG